MGEGCITNALHVTDMGIRAKRAAYLARITLACRPILLSLTHSMPLPFLPAYRMTRRDLRLGSGLVLFVYITSHLANHALGLVSVKVAEAGLRVAVVFWHSAL